MAKGENEGIVAARYLHRVLLGSTNGGSLLRLRELVEDRKNNSPFIQEKPIDWNLMLIGTLYKTLVCPILSFLDPSRDEEGARSGHAFEMTTGRSVLFIK